MGNCFSWLVFIVVVGCSVLAFIVSVITKGGLPTVIAVIFILSACVG